MRHVAMDMTHYCSRSVACDAIQTIITTQRRRRSAGRRGVLAGLVLGAALCTGLYCVAAWLGVVGGLWGGGLAPVVPRDASVGLHLCPSGSSAGPECHGVDLEIAHTIRDLRREASTRFPCTAADDNGGGSDEDFEDNACRLFDADGLELTSEQQLSGLTNGSQLHVVKGDNHFFWPTVRLGYRWRPKHVHSPNPDKPIEMETLSESPRVFLIDNFLSDAEVEYLVAHAEGRLERSHVGIGKETFHNQRTSKTAWDTGSATSLTIQKRGYDLVRQPWNKKTTDAIQVIKYDKGQMYLLHTDYFKVGYQNLDPSKPDGTNRIVTIFMYLSDVDAGGATVFPHARKREFLSVWCAVDVCRQTFCAWIYLAAIFDRHPFNPLPFPLPLRLHTYTPYRCQSARRPPHCGASAGKVAVRDQS